MIAGTAAAQDEDDLIFDLRLAPLADVAPASKDRAMHAALLRLGERLELLPRELRATEPDADQIRAFWAVATGGVGFQFHLDDGEPVVGLTSVPNDSGRGEIDTLMRFLADSAGRDARVGEDGSITIDTPGGPARISTAQAGEGTAVTFLLGRDEPAGVGLPMDVLPGGARPIVAGEFGLGTLLEFAAENIENEDPAAYELLDELGFLDATDSRISFVVGNSGDVLHVNARYEDAEEMFERFVGDAVLSPESLEAVPSDATFVSATLSNLDWLIPLIELAGDEMDRDFFEFLRDGFGIDLRAGVLENLGPTWIVYQADSTGGGGMMSTVLVLDIRDEQAFQDAQAAAVVHANQFGASLGRGYARTLDWSAGGYPARTLVTPGLPVPFEISWAVAEGRLVVAASRVGLVAAIGYLGDGPSVLDNERFRSAVMDRWDREDRVTGVSFRDTARFASRGYGLASLAASAVANAVRKPFDDFWDPGIVMPSYARFAADIIPTGSIATWDGDDIEFSLTGDASVLVQLASASEAYGAMGSAYTPAVLAGVMLPALGQARQSAQQVKTLTQVRALSQATLIYATDAGENPSSTDDLIEIGAITPDMLVSPRGPAWDGRGDIVLRTEFVGDADAASFNPDVVVAMDRAAYVNGMDTVAIGFADGRAEQLTPWQVDEIMAMPINAGAAAQFGIAE
ncbi:MAG: hypothetical protein AAGF47_04660 [Planctomycetota bacterium]